MPLPLKIALIIDEGQVKRWQNQALASLPAGTRCLVLNCRHTGAPKRRLKHAAYYALNPFTIRNRMTRSEPLATGDLVIERTLEFDADKDGAWQSLPSEVRDALDDFAPEAVVKFGMGLLRVPAGLPPVVSYHHGDPRRFRGRPAGFYETLHGEPVMGQIVQILSNKLDAGRVLAFCETKVDAHSYRSTLVRAYSHSPLLLRRALDNLRAGRTEAIEPTGKIYGLPGNLTVARFILDRLRAVVTRIGYGLTMEKKWEVSTAPVSSDGDGAPLVPAKDAWTTLSRLPGYTFYADPFFMGDGAIVLEALDGKRGKGDLVRVGQTQSRISTGPGHHSYPAPFVSDGVEYLLPEIAGWSIPAAFRLEGDRLSPAGQLQLDRRVLDPTPIEMDGRVYLFGNDGSEGPGVLRLWSAPDLFASFVEHPASPILISPKGARMAGGLHRVGSRLFRYGQDGRGAYGDGVIVFEVTRLTQSEYEEREVATIKFADVAGPHTVNFDGERVVFDWYREHFTIGAGVRRLVGRFG